MSVDFLTALEDHGTAKKRGRPIDFTFRHTLCHDFESLILVIVYAMLIRNKNRLVATDSGAHRDYKQLLDDFWGVHSYTKLVNCHEALISACWRYVCTLTTECRQRCSPVGTVSIRLPAHLQCRDILISCLLLHLCFTCWDLYKSPS